MANALLAKRTYFCPNLSSSLAYDKVDVTFHVEESDISLLSKCSIYAFKSTQVNYSKKPCQISMKSYLILAWLTSILFISEIEDTFSKEVKTNKQPFIHLCWISWS